MSGRRWTDTFDVPALRVSVRPAEWQKMVTRSVPTLFMTLCRCTLRALKLEMEPCLKKRWVFDAPLRPVLQRSWSAVSDCSRGTFYGTAQPVSKYGGFTACVTRHDLLTHSLIHGLAKSRRVCRTDARLGTSTIVWMRSANQDSLTCRVGSRNCPIARGLERALSESAVPRLFRG